MNKSRNFWAKINQRNKKCEKDYIEYLGEEIENINDELMEGEIEYYEEIKSLVEEVNKNVIQGSSEFLYQKEMIKQMQKKGLEVKEEVEDKIEDEEGNPQKIRMDLCEIRNNERIIYEIKKARGKHGIAQLLTYLEGTQSVLGFLVIYKGASPTTYIFIKSDTPDYICYDGKNAYKCSPKRMTRNK